MNAPVQNMQKVEVAIWGAKISTDKASLSGESLNYGRREALNYEAGALSMLRVRTATKQY